MQTKLNVKLLEYTPNPERLIATAAKLCYAGCNIEQLMEKQTPESVDKFLNHLLTIGHESPLEHISFTFAVEGVSRALTHQLVRHRIASYSQQSQRYVKLDQFNYIIPPAIEKNELAKKLFLQSMENDQEIYDRIVEALIGDYIYEYVDGKDEEYTLEEFQKNNKSKYKEFEKKAIEDARYVFPNACETKIILTMNFRTLINFIQHRSCERAQWEIREMAIEMIKILKPIIPTLSRNLCPKCCTSRCPEGNLSCMKMNEKKEFFNSL